jgi:L-lysine 2,3-aminomutase
LHLLDKATGTGHFEVSRQEALELIRQVQATLPGYLVPKLVTEQAGSTSKQYIF